MRKFVIWLSSCLLCWFSFLPAACATPEHGQETLSKLLEEKAGGVAESSLYVDVDYDGTRELFAVIAADNVYQIWYCSSDGAICEKVQETVGFFDAAEITGIYNGQVKETHIIINVYNMMGTNKQFSILALREGKVSCLVPWNYGTAGTDAEGNPCMTVEAYDGCYDAASEQWLMHTWKHTWLSYDKEEDTYKEIPAEKIESEEFLQLAHATEYLEQIRTEEKKEDTEEIIMEYFLRRNGVLHVQCFVKDVVGNIAAKYYTLKMEDGVITGKVEQPTDGIMQEQLSGLEAEEQ